MAAGPAASQFKNHRANHLSRPVAPNLRIDVQPRQLQLQWAGVSGARYYRLFEQSGSARRKPIGTLLPAHVTRKSIALAAHLLDWQQTRYFVAACNVAGCTSSQGVSVADQAQLGVAALTSAYEFHEPTAGPANQSFGLQVALSGDGRTLAVSDLWYFGGIEWPWYGSGAVYVYRRAEQGQWALQAQLEPTDARGYDFFGSDLALSADGSTLAVGTQNEGYDAPSQDAGPGSVFVFSRRQGVWSQQAMLRGTNPQDAAAFGRSVEMSASGNVIVVGAPYEAGVADGIAMPEAGAVYVFKRRHGMWEAQAALHAPIQEGYDRFGLGVRLSDDGRTVAVLAGEQNFSTEDFENGGWPNRNNSVYVFEREQHGWSLTAQIEGSIEEPMLGGIGYDYEGQIEAFDLSGDGRTLAVASPYALAPDNSVGLVRMYQRTAGVWSPSDVALAPALPDRRYFGTRLTLSGNGKTLAATAMQEDGAYGRPYVIVFSRSAGQWIQRSALESALYPNYTSFGDSLALSTNGKRLAIGSRSYSLGESYWGAVLVY